ncbi:acyltransferase [Aurantiacibacter sp. MUD11]|uniref:acyltransferase family protein n=1 Tax=Aurantiacibacter sp. MUD11 TaxID=3003265 RepID=UPI0022AA2648|nr:acyltransferase [Aurantiacibacter sp. MUD11]WAT19266.1 acyltransferase [Aurantiacibacter sp. MUD11]
MLGTYRTILALMVVLAHTAVSHVGIASVFGFYVLSGYLMTAACRGVYRGRIGAFCANRLLRIYPCHITCLALAATVLMLGGEPRFGTEQVPQTTIDWLRNIFLIDVRSGARLNPVTWTIMVELVFYCLIPFVAVTRERLAWWLVVSAALWLLSDSEKLYTFAGASLPFALGALITYMPRLRPMQVSWLVGASLTGMAILYSAIVSGTKHDLVSLWVLPLICMQALAVWGLSHIPRQAWDDRIGEHSYPIYLAHGSVLCILTAIPFFDFADGYQKHWAMFFAALALVVPLSFALVHLVERPISSLRAQVRAFRAQADPKDLRLPLHRA